MNARLQQGLTNAWNELDGLDLQELIRRITDVPSPIGGELKLAEMLASELESEGLSTNLLRHSETGASATASLPGGGGGETLLLYSPIDAAWEGVPADEPITGPSDPRLAIPATVRGDLVLGLSAENPKAYVASVVAAGMAIARAGLTLPGTIVIGLGAGGMPVGPGPRPGIAMPSPPGQVGHGVGAAAIVSSVRPDQAIVAKPGNAVSHEEVGLCVFRVVVSGTFGYTGVRHFVRYRNAIVDAAVIVRGLETWFPEYTAEHTSGLVAPQGAIGAIRAGWPEAPAFTPSTCEIWVDLRTSPRTAVGEVEEVFASALGHIADTEGIEDLTHETVLAIPGTSTPSDARIVQTATRAWELVHDRPHEPRTGTSGATDANIIRAMGVPAARIGMPTSDLPEDLTGFSMGVADATAARTLARILCAAAIETCSGIQAETV